MGHTTGPGTGTREPKPLPGLRQLLVRGGVGSLAIKVAGTGIAFLVSVVLARTMGPEGYGVYAFALAMITLLAIPARAGLPELVVRETAKADARENWGLMRGIWRWGNGFVAGFSALMVGFGGLFLWLGGDWLSEARRETFIVGLLLVPFMALGSVRGAALRGLRRVVLGQLPESILAPGLFLVFVLLMPVLWPGFRLEPVHAMAASTVAAFLAYACGAAILHRTKPDPLRARPTPEYHKTEWRRAALPLALLAGLQLINSQTDIVMLGVLRSDAEVGVYRIVLSIATLVILGLQTINQVLQPYFARFYSEGSMAQLQRLVTISARIILAMALPPVVVMVAFGGPILEFLFGADYRVGAAALAILAVGQLINAGMGSVGMLLNMTGHERDTMKGVAIAAVVNIVLNAALIPPFGMEGAAMATASSLLVWNLVLRHYVRRRLSIEPAAIAGRR